MLQPTLHRVRLNFQTTTQLRLFSTTPSLYKTLRIGFVPEHYSTPLHFAQKYYGLDAELLPYPSGTGAMAKALDAGELDMAVGLTEGWIAALAQRCNKLKHLRAKIVQELAENETTSVTEQIETELGHGFKIVGTYVGSPLRWGVCVGGEGSEGKKRFKGIGDLKGAKVGVSRLGSGSHVMSFVLAAQNPGLRAADESTALPSTSNSTSTDTEAAAVSDTEAPSETPSPSAVSPSPFPPIILNTFANLRTAVNTNEADFFLWEYYTCKKYYDTAEITHIGDLYSPWPSWMIVASRPLIDLERHCPASISAALSKISQGIQHFTSNPDEAIQHITTTLDYSEPDARTWMTDVRFATDIYTTSTRVVAKVLDTLVKAKAIDIPLKPGRTTFLWGRNHRATFYVSMHKPHKPRILKVGSVSKYKGFRRVSCDIKGNRAVDRGNGVEKKNE